MRKIRGDDKGIFKGLRKVDAGLTMQKIKRQDIEYKQKERHLHKKL